MTTLTSQFLYLNLHYYTDMARLGAQVVAGIGFIGAGAISMLNLACTAMLDIGDEVLVPDPGWANYVGLMMQVGAVPVPIHLKEENGFMYDVADLQAALTPKTKMILLYFPSNPPLAGWPAPTTCARSQTLPRQTTCISSPMRSTVSCCGTMSPTPASPASPA